MRAGQCGGCFMSEQESVPAMLQWQCSGYWALRDVCNYVLLSSSKAGFVQSWLIQSSAAKHRSAGHGMESKSRCGEQSTAKTRTINMTGSVLPFSLIKMDLSRRSINNTGQVVVGPGSLLLVKVNTGIISYNCPVCQPRPLTHQF